MLDFNKYFRSNKLSRINFRIRSSRITIFFMVALTQRVESFNSIADREKDLHYVFWDMDDCTQEQAEDTLLSVQEEHSLSNIYLVSDYPNSFRAWCFSKVPYKTMLMILLETRYVDKGFFDYAVKRHTATLRISKKQKRGEQVVVSVLKTYFEPVPERFEWKVYDTSYNKNTLNILNGGDN